MLTGPIAPFRPCRARLLLTILSEDHPELQEITSLLASKSAGQKVVGPSFPISSLRITLT